MEIKKNVWLPLEVQGVNIGKFIHSYKEEECDIKIPINSQYTLIEHNCSKLTECYIITLRFEQIGFFDTNLVLSKETFEKLYHSKFTRPVDYFVVAINCNGVYPYNQDFKFWQDTENCKLYDFCDNEHDLRFKFIICSE